MRTGRERFKKPQSFFHPCGAPSFTARPKLALQISDLKTLKGFFTPSGQPEVCPNRLRRRLVEGGSRPYGQSELKIKKATSYEVAFFILVADRTEVEPEAYIV